MKKDSFNEAEPIVRALDETEHLIDLEAVKEQE